MHSLKKDIVAGIIVILVGLYVLFANTQGNMTNTDGATPTPGTTPTPETSPDAGTRTGQYKDGTYTGIVANAFYGNIQVVATITGGKITSVSVPVYPDHPGHTTQVTDATIPVLKQEAITAQGANVQIVSGATQDSQAFQQSLAAALAQAGS
jgi:uncharacterized protein with FMN-binding domain